MKTMNKNKNLDRVFTSSSSFPNFILGVFAFISLRVSFPVNTTQATTKPELAKTVFYQQVFSRLRASI
jgi:hypothetical protein